MTGSPVLRIPLFAPVFLVQAVPATATSGVTTLKSGHDVSETANRLQTALEAKGMD